ncbi:MAG: hypothetical protein HKN85_08685 [Gammaproteobacteria bacterium]|nr:hypothetical protein [Gammaproteobacteria bacterium]
MHLKITLHAIFALSIFITGCSDSGTERPETTTTEDGVQQSDSSSRQAPTRKVSAKQDKQPAPMVQLPIASFADKLTPALKFNEVVQRTNQLTPLLERLRSAIDRSQFDLIALNRRLEFDEMAIVDFVRDAIFFEQYVGVLRGAKGTLLGRAGNALDQSLLLTTLLDDAGYETRIAHGTLTTAQATDLVNQMAQPRPAQPEPGDEAVLQEILDEIMALQGLSAEQRAQLKTPSKDNPYQSATQSDTHFILDALDQAGVTLGDPQAIARLIEEARSYYWVEYRLNAFDEWETAHPAFAAAPKLIADSTFTEPPAELYHRVRFEIFIEQKTGDQLIVNPIISDWESTTAELVGRPFTYQNQPNNLDFETVSDLSSLLSETNIFYPIVNEKLAGNGFDLDGQTFKLGLSAADKINASQLSQSQTRQLGQAAGAISNLGKPAPDTPRSEAASTLTAQWMEYTVITPNAKDKTYRRYTMDRVGVENRENGIAEITDPTDLPELAKSLLTNYSIMAIPNRYSKAYTLERFATRSLQEVSLINKVVANPTVQALSKLKLPALKPGQDVFLALAFDGGFALSPNMQTYRTEATVIVFEEGIIPGSTAETLYERVDIVNNERRTFALGKQLTVDHQAAVRAGVWETHAERAPLRKIGIEFNTAMGFREAVAKNIPLRVLLPEDVASVGVLEHSALTKSNLKELLGQGYAIIVPSKMLPHRSDTVWWRIDLATGNALGMATGGYGLASVEYTILQVVGRSIAAASLGYCIGATGNVGCCFIAGAVLFSISRFIALFSRATALLFGIWGSPVVAGVGGQVCA